MMFSVLSQLQPNSEKVWYSAVWNRRQAGASKPLGSKQAALAPLGNMQGWQPGTDEHEGQHEHGSHRFQRHGPAARGRAQQLPQAQALVLILRMRPRLAPKRPACKLLSAALHPHEPILQPCFRAHNDRQSCSCAGALLHVMLWSQVLWCQAP